MSTLDGEETFGRVTWQYDHTRGCKCYHADLDGLGTFAHIVPTDAKRSIDENDNASLFFREYAQDDHWRIVAGIDVYFCMVMMHYHVKALTR